MPLNTFTPSIAPSPGTKHDLVITINQADFGDGYTQASPKGLNHIRQVVSLRWEGLTQTQYDALQAFFYGQGGYKPFYYQPRGYAVVLKWTCKEWAGSDSTPWRFEAKLEESFTTEV